MADAKSTDTKNGDSQSQSKSQGQRSQPAQSKFQLTPSELKIVQRMSQILDEKDISALRLNLVNWEKKSKPEIVELFKNKLKHLAVQEEEEETDAPFKYDPREWISFMGIRGCTTLGNTDGQFKLSLSKTEDLCTHLETQTTQLYRMLSMEPTVQTGGRLICFTIRFEEVELQLLGEKCKDVFKYLSELMTGIPVVEKKNTVTAVA